MEYQELEIIKETSDKILEYDVRRFLNKIPENLLSHKYIQYYGYTGKEIRVYYLEEVFPILIENGWEYKNTYWKGGENGHKILTFIKGNENRKY